MGYIDGYYRMVIRCPQSGPWSLRYRLPDGEVKVMTAPLYVIDRQICSWAHSSVVKVLEVLSPLGERHPGY